MLNPIATGAPTPLILWSAGCRLKYEIQERYYGTHYCWCSPAFEAAALAPGTIGARTPPSSDPVTIYRQLHAAVKGEDKHDAKIKSYKSSIKSTAIKMAGLGIISDIQVKEIVATVRAASFMDWRPMMYVIPYSGLESRLKLVPFSKRASKEPEYIIKDLNASEFHWIELTPCP